MPATDAGVRYDAIADTGVDSSHVVHLSNCSPVVLTKDSSATRFALDDDYAYFVDRSGTLARVPKTGGSATSLSTRTEPGTVNVSVNATDIYWALPTAGKFVRVAKSGGTTVDVACVSDCIGAYAGDPIAPAIVAVTNDALFAEYSLKNAPTEGILSVTLLRTQTARFIDLLKLPFRSLAVDGKDAAWSNEDTIADVDVGNGGNSVHTAMQSRPLDAVAMNSTLVLWATFDGTDNDVFSLTRNSFDHGRIVVSHVRGDVLAADDTYVYTALGAGGIQRTGIETGLTDPVLANVNPTVIAIDPDCLYYATAVGEIARVPR